VLRFVTHQHLVRVRSDMKKLSPRSLALLSVAALAACARHSGGVVSGAPTGATPRFETRIELPIGTAQHSDYRVADFNGDGRLDMAVVSLTGEFRVLLGNGAALVPVQDELIAGVPSWIDGADFDGDGDEDLVIVRSEANRTELWENDGEGLFTLADSLSVGADALAVTTGDFDGDGLVDVAVSLPNAPQIVVAFNGGTTEAAFGFTQPITLPGGGQAFNLVGGDVTRDGRDDLIVADPVTDRVVVFSGILKGSFGFDYRELRVLGAPGAIALGDLSGDGLTDMAVSAYTGNEYVVITEILGPIGGQLGVPGPFQNEYGYLSFDIPVTARPSVATIADATGDGVADLVACLAGNATMVVAPGLAGGGVGPQFQLDATGLPLRPFVGDFDGNGRPDLFALSGGGDRVNLWLAGDTGRLAGARNFGSGLPGSSWVESADFDRDGDVELVVGSVANSSLSILGRDAAGGLVVEGSIDIGTAVFQVESADLDGDGRVDLVVGVQGGIRVVRNGSTAGNYAFEVLPGSLATIGSGQFPFGIALGDFDRDGDFDIAVCDYEGGGVHVVPGTPAAFVFGGEQVISVDGGPVDVAAADFNGDGWLDLAVSRLAQSDIVVLRNTGGGVFVESIAFPVGQNPNYLVTADFNRDGRGDLVVSNATSGTVSVLFGAGAGFVGQTFPAGLTPTALLAEDLTGDGNIDILVNSLQSGDFRILIGDGNGSFPLLPTFPGTLGASDAVLADMNGDGKRDLVIASLITNRISLVRNITE
jgi:hypothetical protein